jgi:hypothetical protein
VTAPTFTFDGATVPFSPGQSVGAALLAAGIRTLRTTRRDGRPRGLFCAIGACFDCLVEVDGVPDQRACLEPALAGMRVRPGGGPSGGASRQTAALPTDEDGPNG